jgi:hypothetical protein
MGIEGDDVGWMAGRGLVKEMEDMRKETTASGLAFASASALH